MLESSSIGCPHRRRLPMTRTSPREDRETILIGLENSFGSTLLKCCPIGVCEDLDHSWVAFDYYMSTAHVYSTGPHSPFPGLLPGQLSSQPPWHHPAHPQGVSQSFGPC